MSWGKNIKKEEFLQDTNVSQTRRDKSPLRPGVNKDMGQKLGLWKNMKVPEVNTIFAKRD